MVMHVQVSIFKIKKNLNFNLLASAEEVKVIEW